MAEQPSIQDMATHYAEFHSSPVHSNYKTAFRRAVSAVPSSSSSDEDFGYEFFSMPYVQLILAFAQAIANQSNAFCCQFNILPLKRELADGSGSNRRIMTVIHVSCLFITVVYVVFGFCGYYACGADFIMKTDNVLLCQRPELEASNLVQFGVFVVAVTNWLRVPLLVFPLRETLVGWLQEVADAVPADSDTQSRFTRFVRHKNFRLLLNIAVVATLFVFTGCIGNLQVALIILGFSGVPILCYIIPGLMCLKIASDNRRAKVRYPVILDGSAVPSVSDVDSTSTSSPSSRMIKVCGDDGWNRISKVLGGYTLTVFGVAVSFFVFTTFLAKNIYHVSIHVLVN